MKLKLSETLRLDRDELTATVNIDYKWESIQITLWHFKNKP